MFYDIHTVCNCYVEIFNYSTMISTSHLSFKLLYLNLMLKNCRICLLILIYCPTVESIVIKKPFSANNTIESLKCQKDKIDYDHTGKGQGKYELTCRCQKACCHIANTSEYIKCANS